MTAQMAYSLKGVEPYQMGFKQSALCLKSQLSLLPGVAPGKIPGVMKSLLEMAESLVLAERREQHYPRAVKKRPQRYALRPASKA
jgi:hypothetical protein